MGRSLSFGSTAYDLIRSIKTRFRFGSVLMHLTLPYTVSRRLIMQKACSRASALLHFVDV